MTGSSCTTGGYDPDNKVEWALGWDERHLALEESDECCMCIICDEWLIAETGWLRTLRGGNLQELCRSKGIVGMVQRGEYDELHADWAGYRP